MSKPLIRKPDGVADKLNEDNNNNNKPDAIVKVDHGSPITPLQTRSSGLTSTATTCSSSCSPSSSRSVTGHAARKPNSDRPISFAAQSSKSTTPSTVKSSKSSTASAAQSRSSSPACAQSRSSIRLGIETVCPKTGTGIKTPSNSVSGTTKPSRNSSNASQQHVKIFPAGNIFPSGKVQITGMAQEKPRTMVLGPGAKTYGYGSIIRGNNLSPVRRTRTSGSSSVLPLAICSSTGVPDADISWKVAMYSSNPEEVKRIGNKMFKKGCFTEALKLYDRAIELSPTNATYHSNRAAALSNLSQIGEAVNECEKAIKLDPKFARAHHRLAVLLLRLGYVNVAGVHLYSVEEPSDPMVVKMLQQVDKHLNKCTYARRRGEWNIVLTEVSAAMASGADFSPQLAMCKIEALLKLRQLDDAQRELECVPKVEPFPVSLAHIRFFDMICGAYSYFVKSQMELTLGRFENAVTNAEKALDIDPPNCEVKTLYRNVRLIARARDRGNDLYELKRYTEASSTYAEGLKYDPSNATLLCHRADCLFKVGMWESSVEYCNRALLILPRCTKTRLQRAASYSKLERWAEAVSDYETLRKELPYDKEIAKSLFHSQVALRKSRGEVVLNMELGGEVEEISSLEELKVALTRPGVSIVHFFRASDQQCNEMTVFIDALCVRYPSLHFLKVEVVKCPAVGDTESVRVVPTFKIYKLGILMKEIVCPSKEALEKTVRHYGL